jgi:hypothetical protein
LEYSIRERMKENVAKKLSLINRSKTISTPNNF